LARRRRAITAILTRAAERGEVRPERIIPPITRLPGDLLRHEMMLKHGDPPDAFLAEILDEVFPPRRNSTAVTELAVPSPDQNYRERTVAPLHPQLRRQDSTLSS
jgi:Tetracyclin repressor-like, C-terminal domain